MDNVENFDITNFQINMDNGRKLELCGYENVKYVDAIFGGERTTMFVQVFDGPRS